MSAPFAAPSNLAAIPVELRERAQWVLFRIEEREGKSTKVPYSVRSPVVQASTNDPATWASFAEAVAALPEADGLGYVFAIDDPYTGIDLDGCRDPETGLLELWAVAIVQRLDSYTESSLSGTGAHVLVRAEKPGDRSRNGKVEIYDTGRYFAMTGWHVAGTPTSVEERQAALDGLYAELFPVRPKPAPPRNVAPLEIDDEELLSRARAARNGSDFERLWRGDTRAYGSHSEADLALCGALAFWMGGPDPGRIDSLFRRSGLMREKWDARRGESTYGAETIARALEGRTEFYSPSIKSTLPNVTPIEREPGEQIDIIRLADIRARATEWLFPGLIPRGRVTILYGEEGMGKGLWWISLAAELSLEQKATLAFVTEDRPDEDLKPRFLAAGGDPAYLMIVNIRSPRPGEPPRELDLARDADFFEQAINESGAVLVVVDPLIGQITVGFDADKAQHVRGFMNPLDAVCAKQDAALLGVVHLNRSHSSDPMHRVSASKAFRELARSTLILARDPDDHEGDARVLALDKSNLAQKASSRRYTIERQTIEIDGAAHETARLAFLGESSFTARQLLTPPEELGASKLEQAKGLLRALLADGPLPVKTVEKAVTAADISEETFRRARRELGVVAERIPDTNAYRWRLPEHDAEGENDV